MEQSRQMYIKRELRRRRIEKRQMVIERIKFVVSAIALVLVTEAFMFSLLIFM